MRISKKSGNLRAARRKSLGCGRLWTAALLIFLSANIPNSAAAQSGRMNQHVPVATQNVTSSPNITTYKAVAVTRAIQSAVLRPDSEGRVETVFMTSGQTVVQGQQLLKLDSASEELKLAAAKENVEVAERVFERIGELKSRGVAPDAQYDDAILQLSEARFALKEAELALERRYVVAPFSGTLGLVNLSAGAHVTTDTDVVQLEDLSSLLLDFSLPEHTDGSLQPGSSVSISQMTSHASHTAKVIAIASGIDPQARTYWVRAAIDDPKPWMKPGMSFMVTLTVKGEEYPVIPEVAILWGSREAYVLKIVEGKARRTAVTVIRRRNGNVWVDGDLTDGDIVVSDGVHKLRDGHPVSVPQNQSDQPASVGEATQ